MKTKTRKAGNKKKQGPKKSGLGSPSKNSLSTVAEAKSEMVSALSSSTSEVAEAPAPTSGSIVPNIDEKDEKVIEKTPEPRVTSEKVEEPEESAVVDNCSEKEKEEEEEYVEDKLELGDGKEDNNNNDLGENEVEFYNDGEEEDYADEGEGEEGEEDNVDGKEFLDKKQSDDEESIAVSEPEVFTEFDWEKKDDDYNVQQAVFIKAYFQKFSAFLRFIDPEFRLAAEIGPCGTFDAEGVKILLEKMKEIQIENAWPFDNNFEATPEHIRLLLSEVLNKTKFCLKLACAERGYEYKSGKPLAQPVSAVWEDQLNPILELKTIKAIMAEMKEHIMKHTTEGQEARFWSEFDNICDIIMPALELFDSKTLAENSISDCMSSIHGRLDLGFEIKEEDVDEMLEHSFSSDGFGEFPPTALYAPSVFTTANQLKMIYGQLEKMSTVIDIRVKLAGVQTITRIFEQISEEETQNLMEEFKAHSKIPFEKMFGVNPLSFEVNKQDQKRTQYLKMFYSTLGESTPKEEFEFSKKRLVAAFECFYLVFSAEEVNMVLYKILATGIKTESFDNDRKMLVDVLLMLPEHLKTRLEIGPGYNTGLITDMNTDSMYSQIIRVMNNVNKEGIEAFCPFLFYLNGLAENDRILSLERIMRYAMDCVESGRNQSMAVSTLKILKPSTDVTFNLSKAFFEDLIIMTLSKYSLPEKSTPVKKYEFIETVFDIISSYKERDLLDIDESKIVEKWTDLGHPWFSVLYLSHRFPVLKFSTLVSKNKPWLSSEVWTDDKEDKTDLKNYIQLAKVPTSWPNCTDLKVIEDLIIEHVPLEIPRLDLYQAMREKVAEFSIDEGWRQKLFNAFSGKIQFLAPKPKKEKKKSHQDDTHSSEQQEKKHGTKTKKYEKPSSQDVAEHVPKVEGELLQEVQNGDDQEVHNEKGVADEKLEKVEIKGESIDLNQGGEKVENVAIKEKSNEDENADIETKSKDLEKEDEKVEIVEIKRESEAVVKAVPANAVETSTEESHVRNEVLKPLIKEVCQKEVGSIKDTAQTEQGVNPGIEGKEKDGIDEMKKDVGKKDLISLEGLPSDCFYAFYDALAWETFEDRVKTEVLRQRESFGYSNKL